MTCCRIHNLLPLATGLAALAAIAPATAQTGPGPQLNLVVGFAAGGSADSIARIVGNRVGEIMKRRVVIENRPGAGANVAAKAVIAARPDGNTLLVTTAALPINNTLYKNKGFRIEDLRPVSIAASTPETLVINTSNPAKTLAEFLANAKGKSINYGTAGVGTGSHVVAAYFFKEIAKIDAKHVPFRGGPDATNNLLGGHVDLVAASLSGVATQINSGAIRGIAIATAERFPAVPNVPTYAELGYKGLLWSSWAGFLTHAKAPDETVARLNAAMVEALNQPDVRDRLLKIGFSPMSGELKESESFFSRELAEWGKMVTALGLSVK